MRYAFLLVFVLALTSHAQVLRDINYSYIYNPTEPFVLNIKIVRSPSGWTAHYNFVLTDTTQEANQYLIQWDKRTTLEEKQGTFIETAAIESVTTGHRTKGKISLPSSASPQILTAKVLNNAVKKAWIFYKIIEPNYPVNGYLTSSGAVVQQPYIISKTPVSVSGSDGAKVVSYYRDDFPAALPAFSEGMGKVTRNILVDSTFTVAANETISFENKGLYLVQTDTSAIEGFAFRVEDDYPRLKKIESLADPLIYICTKQEFEKVKAAKGDKKAFDRIILGITGNSERAKEFIRNYYRRVEWANFYFTSYKEGWKTDRGMIYMLFGLPDELYKFTDREVWVYKSASVDAKFNFVKSSTIFDPDNYVLIREKKFQETWYEKIDLWRNARF
jgi:GWxTD domain-containing protein